MSFNNRNRYIKGSLLGDEIDNKHASGLRMIEMTGFISDNERDQISNEAIKLMQSRRNSKQIHIAVLG